MASIIGYMVALALSMFGVAGFLTYAKIGLDNVRTAATAQQLAIVSKAASQYTQDNSALIATIATPTVPVNVSGAMLASAGYLQGSFAATNPFRQTWLLQILQPTPGRLQAVLTSQGGVAIADPKQLVQIAAQAGAQGGFIPYARQAGDATMVPTDAYGAYGAWRLSLTGYSNPGSGHLASLLAFTGSQSGNGFLYRVSVPNQPQLNVMQTDLGLTDSGGTKHDINGVGTLNAVQANLSGGASGSLNVGKAQFYGDSQNVALRTGASGSIYLQGPDGQTSADIAQVKNVTAQGAFRPGNIGTPGQSCANNGDAVGNADQTGQWLVCHFGKYEPMGGPWILYQTYPVSYGSTVPAPICSAGAAPKIVMATQNFTVDNTATVNWVTQGSGPWVMFSEDGVGAPISAVGIASTYCAYN